jgi:expansin
MLMRVAFFVAMVAGSLACGDTDGAASSSGGSSGAGASGGGGDGSSGGGSSGGSSNGGGSNGGSSSGMIGGPLGAPITGEGTYYNANGTGSCSFPASPGDLDVAAMAAPLYNNAAYCGSCVDVTGPKGTLRVRIVDKCPECKSGDLDLSESAFVKIADRVAGRVPITWRLVRCDVSGPVQYQIKDGAHKFWTAVQVRNHAIPIERMEMEKAGTFINAPRVDYNYFVLSSGILTDGPFKVRVYGLGGKMLEDTIPAPIAKAVSSGTKNFE